MTRLADDFSTIFREEHREVRDGLLQLVDAFLDRSPEQARKILGHVAGLTGPHFRYEEEVMYPQLTQFFGSDYVETLYVEHDGVIASAQRLVELVGQDSWTDAQVEEGVRLIREMLPHVSGCDGLSIMVERLDDDGVRAILDARDRSNEAGADLITWASEIRQSR